MNKKISEVIFKKIKESHIKPKPKWEFLLKDYTIWTLFGISLIVGGLAFSVIFYMFANNDWNLYQYVSGSFIGFFFVTLPYFWLIILVMFIVLAYYNLRHTKRGYLLSLRKIFLFSLLSSFLLGGVLYFAGLGKSINSIFNEKVPFYEKVLGHRNSVWNNPQRGLLAGEVIEIITPQKFYLIDLKGDKWCVECFYESGCFYIEDENNKIVKIIGDLGEECFQAKIIKPFRPIPCPRGEYFEHLDSNQGHRLPSEYRSICPNCSRH
ncbi:hypothetical protein K8R62_02550 [bacterium]|nr:hypothetical protein [bacterium]